MTGSDCITEDEIMAFGSNLLKTETAEVYQKPILKSIWKCILRLNSLKAYVQCCDIWIEFVVKYFSLNELEIVLENILQKLLPNKVCFLTNF